MVRAGRSYTATAFQIAKTPHTLLVRTNAFEKSFSFRGIYAQDRDVLVPREPSIFSSQMQTPRREL